MQLAIHDQVCRLKLPQTASTDDRERLEACLQAAIDANCRAIVIDCTSLQFIDLRHIRLLNELIERTAPTGIRLEITCGVDCLLAPETIGGMLGAREDTLLADIRPAPEGAGSREAGAQVSMSMQFAATDSDVRDAIAGFDRYLDNLDISGVYSYALRSIFYEATMNIFLHANLSPGELISVSMEYRNNSMSFVFTNEGIPFDSTIKRSMERPASDSSGYERMRFGLAILQALSDSMTYKLENGKTNVLRIEKEWTK